MDQNLATQISLLEALPTGIGDSHRITPETIPATLQSGRFVIASVDRDPAVRTQLGPDRWLGLIHRLQILAYHDPDNGGEVDIALWCERQWATELQQNPENVMAIQGLGHAWLLKSQRTLARISHEQGSSSTDTSSSSLSRNGIRTRASNNRDTVRINTQDYVEARDMLRPSLESFDRAIQVADAQNGASGELLTLAAEAYISFGNVSHPQNNETYYQTALRLLRRASNIQGYELVAHLQHFLHENVRFIE